MKTHRLFGLITVSLALTILAGCGGKKPLPMQAQIEKIHVGQTTRTQARHLLGEEKVLESDTVMSVLRQKGWARELTLIRFDPRTQVAQEHYYIQTRSRTAPVPLFFNESLIVTARFNQTADEITPLLDKTIEPHAAWLHWANKQLADTGRGFLHDQLTGSLVSMGRSSIQSAALEVQKRPRDIDLLDDSSGMAFEHPDFGGSRLYVTERPGNRFTLTIVSEELVDFVDTW